jgi:hypothetical protein
MVHVDLGMSRRLPHLLLAAVIALSGVLTCPSGVLSCTIVAEAKHDCCGDRSALAASDCCCKGSQAGDPTIGGDPWDARPFKVHLSAALPGHALALGGAGPALRAAERAAALPPPDTPITRHNTLIL